MGVQSSFNSVLATLAGGITSAKVLHNQKIGNEIASKNAQIQAISAQSEAKQAESNYVTAVQNSPIINMEDFEVATKGKSGFYYAFDKPMKLAIPALEQEQAKVANARDIKNAAKEVAKLKSDIADLYGGKK